MIRHITEVTDQGVKFVKISFSPQSKEERERGLHDEDIRAAQGKLEIPHPQEFNQYTDSVLERKPPKAPLFVFGTRARGGWGGIGAIGMDTSGELAVAEEGRHGREGTKWDWDTEFLFVK